LKNHSKSASEKKSKIVLDESKTWTFVKLEKERGDQKNKWRAIACSLVQ